LNPDRSTLSQEINDRIVDRIQPMA